MKRTILIFILAIALLSLCLYYQASYQEHSEYPGVKQITANYTRYIYSEVYVGGEVTALNDNGFELSTWHDGKDTAFKVDHNSTKIEIGDRVSIIGNLEPNYILTPNELLVSRKWDYYLVFIRSILALPILLYLFHKNWQLDSKQKLFRRR